MGSRHTSGEDRELKVNPEHMEAILLVRRIVRARRWCGLMMVGVLVTGFIAAGAFLGDPQREDGDPSSHTFSEVDEGSGQPVAYDPCQPINYVLNPGDAPEDLQRLLQEAITQIEESTGLDFVFEAVDTEAKVDDRTWYMPEKYGQRWSPVLVTFSTPEEIPTLSGNVLGGAQSLTHPDGPYYVTGIVMYDTPELSEWLDAPRGHAKVRAVLVHELFHLVGLDHVDDETQLMNEANTGQTVLGAGDREGLRRLGSVPCAPATLAR